MMIWGKNFTFGKIVSQILFLLLAPFLLTMLLAPSPKEEQLFIENFSKLSIEWTKLYVPGEDFKVVKFGRKEKDLLIFGKKTYLSVQYEFYNYSSEEIRKYYRKKLEENNWKEETNEKGLLLYVKNNVMHLELIQEEGNLWTFLFSHD